jgi:hypothetical protein
MVDAALARRDVLKSLALAPLALAPLRRTFGALPDVAALARELSQLDLEAAFARLDELRRHGLTPHQALSAIFLAGITEIRPRPVGFKLHAVMMVASAHDIVRASPAREQWLPVFWNLGDMKRAQARDADEGDWRLAGRTAERSNDPLADLEAATAGDDEEATDRASLAAFTACDADATFDALWPRAAGDYHNLGHKVIHAAQTRRALDQLGWSHGEPVLRALAYALIAKGEDRSRASARVSRMHVTKLPASWATGSSEPAAALAILRALRPLEAEAAVAAVAKASTDGASAATLFDAMRLRALELLLNRPSLLAVHGLTAVDAFATVLARSQRDDTRRFALLQCAAWLGHYRGDLRVGDGSQRIDELEALPADAPPARVLELAADDRDVAIGHALHAAQTASGQAQLIEAARAVLVRKAQEHHDYKFAAAVFAQARAAHHELAPRLLAAAFAYLRHARQDDSEDVARAMRLMAN